MKAKLLAVMAIGLLILVMAYGFFALFDGNISFGEGHAGGPDFPPEARPSSYI